MADSIMYHDGNRQLQDRFDSRRISDQLEEKLTRVQFSSDDRTFIECHRLKRSLRHSLIYPLPQRSA